MSVAIGETFGFIFAFKVYRQGEGEKEGAFVDCLENLVHRITHSDIIHVEIIPVVGTVSTGDPQFDTLEISQTAYSAYIGLGFDEHDSSFCISDPTYQLVYIPMTHENTMRGVEYLHSQRGKRYNYLALPLTVLPSWCKKRSFPAGGAREAERFDGCVYYYEQHDFNEARDSPTREILLSPSKVFCSQLGLTLCYLCCVFPESYDFSSAFAAPRGAQSPAKPFFIDPMCCTPAELYRLLLSSGVAAQWPQGAVAIHETH